jgi:8-oxo-dGTP diphosphatase
VPSIQKHTGLSIAALESAVNALALAAQSTESNLELARATGADGVHLQTRQFMKNSAPPAAGLWAASCHNREERMKAASPGAGFAVLSPVLPTKSHPGAPALGWDKFRELCIDLPMPVYALGGMKTDMLASAMTYSAHGVALLSGIW